MTSISSGPNEPHICFGPKPDIGPFSSSDEKAPASKPGLFREHDEIGLDSGLIAEGIV
jgi:hypothetical protein